uniref:Uncharacterized protein n=1 Tax=Chrysotila carterae TaxID=13221 RepID=A0A7S4EUL8_CHRCT
MPQRPEPKLMYSRGRGIGKRDRGRHGGALRGKTVPDAGHGCNSTSVGGRRSSQKTGALDSFTELGKDPFEDVLALGSSPQATEPQPVDPLWVAEWSTMIQQLPPLKESAAAATSGDRSRWPKPLVVPKYECKRWRLWGLPTSELAKPSTNAGNSMRAPAIACCWQRYSQIELVFV